MTYNDTVSACVCIAYLTADNQCVSCDVPQYWDNSTKTCAECPTGFIYDSINMKCSCPPTAPY